MRRAGYAVGGAMVNDCDLLDEIRRYEFLNEMIREKEEQHKKEDFSLKQGQKQCEVVKRKLDQLHAQQGAQKGEMIYDYVNDESFTNELMIDD